MKRQIFKWFIALMVCMIPAALFTACGGDDEPETSAVGDIAGYWIHCGSDIGGPSVGYALEIKKFAANDFRYRLWHYGPDHHLCMDWTSVIASSISLDDYECGDYTGSAKIASVSGEIGGRFMDLKDESGIRIFFREVSKQEFENDYIHESLGDSPGSGGGTTDYARLVSQNSSAKGVFSDYDIVVSITHTLKDKLAGVTLDYKILHGRRGATEAFGIDYSHNPIEKSVSSSNGETVVTFKYPMFYYFMARMDEATTQAESDYYEDIIVKCEMCMTSYKALLELEKQNGGLSSEELQFKNDLIRYLNEYKSMIIGDYSVWTYIDIKGKSYLCSNINF